MKDVILYFTDLEGTILRESDGKYDKDELFKFFQQLSKLQEQMDAKVKINIVSPVWIKQMEQIVKDFNAEIADYNENKEIQDRLGPINAAVASQDNKYFSEDYTWDVIEPFPSVTLDGGEKGKFIHVDNWMKTIPDAKLYIYAGNGRNDLRAMKRVVAEDNGFVICPKNSRKQVKEIASFVSEEEDLGGIIDGLQKVNGAIEKAKLNNKNRQDLAKDVEENER